MIAFVKLRSYCNWRTRKLVIQYVMVVGNSICQGRMPVLATRRCTGKRGALL